MYGSNTPEAHILSKMLLIVRFYGAVTEFRMGYLYIILRIIQEVVHSLRLLLIVLQLHYYTAEISVYSNACSHNINK